MPGSRSFWHSSMKKSDARSIWSPSRFQFRRATPSAFQLLSEQLWDPSIRVTNHQGIEARTNLRAGARAKPNDTATTRPDCRAYGHTIDAHLDPCGGQSRAL